MLYNIQFLRFVAAMLVVLYHTAARLPANHSIFQPIFSAGESLGFAGVDIFFVISGFIMAHTSSKNAGLTDSLDFARRRLARIFSGYWPFFILAALIFGYFRPEHLAESNLYKSFLLWPQPLNHVLLEITWTLSYELYFYLLFSFLILLSNPRNRNGIILLAFALLLAFNVYRHFVADSFSEDNIYYLSFWSQFLTSPFLLEFFGGALVAWWVTQRPEGPALIWLLTGSVLFLAGGWINELVYSGLIEQGFHVVPRVFVYGLPACMLLTGLVRLEMAANRAESTSSKRGNGLRHMRGMRAPARFSALTGGASYAIYLSHILILTVVWNTGFNQLVASWPDSMIITAYVLLMSAILGYSVLHYAFLEKPLHRLFKRWVGLSSDSSRNSPQS
ncbi:MAG TPA: acyltransferase [Xanthomonadales bacterium]